MFIINLLLRRCHITNFENRSIFYELIKFGGLLFMDHPVYVYVYIREQVKINHVHNKVVNSVKCLGFQYVFQYSNSEN